MPQKFTQCPSCSHKITIHGEPGEKITVTCPECGDKGLFIFPKEPAYMDQSVIEVTNLTKIYEKQHAVNNATFTVRKGEIFGFLGPNGAGKTTTIKSILGLINTNSGTIKVNGFDIKKNGKDAKKYVGYLPEKVAFYDNLTALQNMRFYAEMKNTSKEQCISLIQEFGLAEAMNKKVGKFSKGMVQRLGMARAILGNPSILIFDEPSGGLDPRGVKQIRDKIKELKSQGATIFVSSHILKEIQDICDRVCIINKGVIVAKDSVSELSRKLNIKPKIVMELEEIPEKLIESVKKIKGVDTVKVIGKMMHVVCNSDVKAKVIVTIAKSGGNIINFETIEPSLEEVFMRYTEA